jgi:hypothetical protein
MTRKYDKRDGSCDTSFLMWMNRNLKARAHQAAANEHLSLALWIKNAMVKQLAEGDARTA